MKNYFIYFFLIFNFILFAQEKEKSIYDNLTMFSVKTSDSLNIKEISSKYNQNEFKDISSLKSYKKLGDKTLWFHLSLENEKANQTKYFTIDNPYLSYGKVYLRKNNEIKELHRVSYYKEQPFKFLFYRLPVWKILADDYTNTDVFIELRNNGGRSRIELFLEDENTFLKRIQIEYIQHGLFIAFLISMILILLFFAILKKEYSVIFYAVYVLSVLIAFLGGTGVGIQFLWSDSSFLTHNIRSLSQTLGLCFIGLFYFKFYKFKTNQKIAKNIFKWGIIITIPLIMLYAYKYFFGGFRSLYLYVWTILKLIGVLWFLNHIYLITKKQIPFYLVIAFMLPILTVVMHQNINPSVFTPYWQKTLIKNIYYVTVIVEILLITRYIFDAVIKTQQKYFELKKLSDELQYNFQNKTLEIQHEERNKLVNNVHDTFGGYLEALKLRLLQKTANTPEKVQEILDAFYKDYHYLLNSLYSPKINAENFVENLIEFCEKLNGLIDNKINHHFSISNSNLSQEKCIHLYRIISELVTNAIKHANASKIEINLKEGNNIIIIEVTDNGIGFNQNTSFKKGFGLKNIQDRVQQIDGELTINSTNSGSNFTITTPNND